jgi:hypothetical protein
MRKPRKIKRRGSKKKSRRPTLSEEGRRGLEKKKVEERRTTEAWDIVCFKTRCGPLSQPTWKIVVVRLFLSFKLMWSITQEKRDQGPVDLNGTRKSDMGNKMVACVWGDITLACPKIRPLALSQ